MQHCELRLIISCAWCAVCARTKKRARIVFGKRGGRHACTVNHHDTWCNGVRSYVTGLVLSSNCQHIQLTIRILTTSTLHRTMVSTYVRLTVALRGTHTETQTQLRCASCCNGGWEALTPSSETCSRTYQQLRSILESSYDATECTSNHFLRHQRKY